jgi:hypothetical protein
MMFVKRGPNTYRRWTQPEDDVFKEAYRNGGMKAVRDAFPSRTPSSLKNRASILHLRSPFSRRNK